MQVNPLMLAVGIGSATSAIGSVAKSLGLNPKVVTWLDKVSAVIGSGVAVYTQNQGVVMSLVAGIGGLFSSHGLAYTIESLFKKSSKSGGKNGKS